MRVAEENFKIVYLLTDAEMAALFDYYDHGQFEKDNHPVMHSFSDRRFKPDHGRCRPTVEAIKSVDVSWPATGKVQRYYRQEHPRNADVLRISQPINSNEEPKWLRKHLK